MWWAMVALAADPSVDVVWRGTDARLMLRPPVGEHVAEEAPVDVEMLVGGRQVVFAGLGRDIKEGVVLGEARGQRLRGVVAASFCEDAGTRCRLVRVDVDGLVPDEKKGTVLLTVVHGAFREDRLPFPSQVDANQAFLAAQSESRRQRSPLLVEFGAVWCPPCNLLQAEVLEVRPRPAVVDGFVIVTLDVDDASSWPIKDRFNVSGYPTVVALDPDGVEIGRIVGYPGLEDTVQWLDDVLTREVLRPSGAPDAHAAALLAWQALREEREEDARTWLLAAAGDPDSVEYRLTRFRLDPSPQDAAWLATRAPEQAMEWVPFAVEAARADPDVRSAVLAAIDKQVISAGPDDAADLLGIAGELLEGETARLAFAAAAHILQGQLTGDPRKDKGRYNWLAYLLEHAGSVDASLSMLDKAAASYPDEPTFHAALARLHLRQGHLQEALVAAEEAYDVAWGDNKLTAGRLKAEVLLALGRDQEARAFVHTLLEQIPAPPPELEVRTHRYRQQLLELVGDAPKP